MPTPDWAAADGSSSGTHPLHFRPAGPLPAVPVPSGMRIVPVRDSAGVRDFERVVVDGYPSPDLQPLVPGSLFDERVLTAGDHTWRSATSTADP